MAEAGTYGLTIGTYEEALAWVGRTSEPRFAEAPIAESAIRQYVAAIEDPNPLYWDPAVAREIAGGPVAPPAMLVTFTTPPRWSPAAEPPPQALLVAVPMPGDSMINISSEYEFFDRLRVGDRLEVVESVESVSEEKETRVGRGHFLTVVARFRRENGELVATQRNVMLRFWAKGAKS
jgi:acyl dehydratase